MTHTLVNGVPIRRDGAPVIEALGLDTGANCSRGGAGSD